MSGEMMGPQRQGTDDEGRAEWREADDDAEVEYYARKRAEWREAYNVHLNSPAWARFRHAALERAGYACQICAATVSDGRGPLQVHHRTYRRLGHEEPHDVIVVCSHCHRLITADRRHWDLATLCLRIEAREVVMERLFLATTLSWGWNDWMDRITPSDFTLPEHGKLWHAIQSLEPESVGWQALVAECLATCQRSRPAQAPWTCEHGCLCVWPALGAVAAIRKTLFEGRDPWEEFRDARGFSLLCARVIWLGRPWGVRRVSGRWEG